MIGLRKVFGILLLTVLLLFPLRGFLKFDLYAYSDFADKNAYFGIDHFWNVISNLGFLFLGSYGIRQYFLSRLKNPMPIQYLLFSMGVFFTAFGSAFFHWRPISANLFYDQLPMSLGFAAFVCLLISDRIDAQAGKWSTLISIPYGFFTVWEIYFGRGETSFYMWFQAGALLFSILLLMLRPKGVIPNAPIYLGIGAYFFAKVLEALDKPIFESVHFSGHSMKHIMATLALASIFKGINSKVKI